MASGTAPLATVQGAGTAQSTNGYLPALVALTTLFFMWGFLTCLNDVIIPHFKTLFDLSYAQAMLVQTAFFAAYGVMSIPSSRLVRWLGYKLGIIVGLGGGAAGCLLFYPAASAQSYPFFLFALFVLATGIVVIQVSANPYVAELGPAKTASSRLTLTQAFNSAATMIAPEFGRHFILKGTALDVAAQAALAPAALVAYRLSESQSVQLPYVGLAAALVLLAALIWFAKMPRIHEPTPEGGLGGRGQSAWVHPHLVWGALAIFAYVGAEVAIGSIVVNYFKLPKIAGLGENAAAGYLKYYGGGAMIGRFIGSFTLRRFRPSKLLGLHALAAIVLLFVTMATSGRVAMWSVLAVGLFNSIMFPTIFTLAVDGLGSATEQGSGILCTAIIGGAAIPPLQGKLADLIGPQPSFVVPALCYAYIVWYGLKGSKLRRSV